MCWPFKPFHSIKILHWDTCRYSSNLSDSNIIILLFYYFFLKVLDLLLSLNFQKIAKPYFIQHSNSSWNVDFMKNFSAVRYLKKLCLSSVIYTTFKDLGFKVTCIHYLQFPQCRTELCFQKADLQTCKNRKLPDEYNVCYICVTSHLS